MSMKKCIRSACYLTGTALLIAALFLVLHNLREDRKSGEQAAGTDIAQMTSGDAESWDLTLFTCTLSGQSRVTVRAALAES